MSAPRKSQLHFTLEEYFAVERTSERRFEYRDGEIVLMSGGSRQHGEIASRPAVRADEPFLWEMLYQSLYVEEGADPFPRNIVNQPHLARYVEGWGRAGDMGFVAVDSDSRQPFGAVWSRLPVGENKGFAYVDDATPELSIAFLPEYRGKGIGTRLLNRYLEAARKTYEAVSLSVSPNNPARRLYARLGFEVVEVRGTHPVMRKILNG
jgi:ribosomal protein S18 acetylase RimI-like enzyme